MSLAIVPGYSRYMAKASTTGKSDLLGTKMTLIVSVFGIVMIALSTKKWMAVFCKLLRVQHCPSYISDFV